MSDLSFPITSQPNPPWTWEAEDNTLRSTNEDGFVIARPRYTRARDSLTDVTWNLSGTEADIVQNFYKNTTANGSLSFNLTLITPFLTLSKKVYFTKPPTHRYVGIGAFETTCSFMEV